MSDTLVRVGSVFNYALQYLRYWFYKNTYFLLIFQYIRYALAAHACHINVAQNTKHVPSAPPDKTRFSAHSPISRFAIPQYK